MYTRMFVVVLILRRFRSIRSCTVSDRTAGVYSEGSGRHV